MSDDPHHLLRLLEKAVTKLERQVRYANAGGKAAQDERPLKTDPIFENGKHVGYNLAAGELNLRDADLHPTGRCTCCGEDTCDWCVKISKLRTALEPKP